MRAILDQDEEEIFFEILMNDLDLEKLVNYQGVLLRLPYGIHGKKTLNIFVRKINRREENAVDKIKE